MQRPTTVDFIVKPSLLGSLYPDQIVQSPFASQLQATRLVDDAFIRICDMVNDSSMTVRAKVISSTNFLRLYNVEENAWKYL
jgi:integrator complex subunit 4